VQGHHVCGGEELVASEVRGADGLGIARGHVAAPRGDPHAERMCDGRDEAADVAQAHDAERAPAQLRWHADHPATRAHRRVLGGDAAHQRQDQRPGVLDGRGDPGQPVGAADHHAALARRSRIEHRVGPTARHDESQTRQRIDDRARQRRALAHQHHGVEPGESLDQCVVAHVVGEEHELGAPAQRRPRIAAGRSTLVVVEDRDAHVRSGGCHSAKWGKVMDEGRVASWCTR
jgi:hypothetical protein